jgi:RNA polymerase sigma factor (sigma-70 family)
MAEAHTVDATRVEDLADEVLLERYTARREEAAFAVLVRRYGPLVLSVCRRVLHHEQDAEDAFQAVFCVLARKAESITKRAAVGAWLHGVAFRIARKARAGRGRQPVSQSDLPDIPAAESSPEWAWKELRPILDEEVNRLPAKYRQAFILCYLEGRTNEQAAAQLGCPLGTVLSRLARARERLRVRLTRRGVALSAGVLAAALGQHAAAAGVPAGLADTAVQVGLRYAARQAVGAGVAWLADWFLKTLPRARSVILLGLVSALVVVVVVVGLMWFRSGSAGQGGALTPAARAAAAIAAERAKLQGTWRWDVPVPKNGPAMQGMAVREMHYFFRGSQWGMTSLGPQARPVMHPFTIAPSQEPKAIDLTMPDGKVVHGIYRLEGDTLTLCLDYDIQRTGRPRPTAFLAQPDAGIVLQEVKREPGGPGAP